MRTTQVKWRHIEQLKIINLVLLKIIVIYSRKSRKKIWFNYFSYSTIELEHVIRKFQPDIIIKH